MIGDILVIEEHHKKAARQVIDCVADEISKTSGKYIITIAGESGSGKSEIAQSIASSFKSKGISSYILQQDDYFVYPPDTNAKIREDDINWVGTQEVKLDLMDTHLKDIKADNRTIVKPLVNFKEDTISEETIHVNAYNVIIVEGTYTTLLNNADKHVFIDKSSVETKEARSKRNRESQNETLERILEIEHRIIASHKQYADIIINKNYDVELNTGGNYE